jgi:hypothetical protein
MPFNGAVKRNALRTKAPPPVEGSDNRRFYAGGIKSPADAVKAAIVPEAKAK